MHDLFMDFDDVARGYGHAMYMARVMAGAVMQVWDKVEYVDVDDISYVNKIVNIRSNMRTPEEAIGHIAKEFVYAYPPGIPYIVPGETIEAATIETMRQMEGSGIKLISTRHQYPEYIETCK